jgi:threonine dehydratase
MIPSLADIHDARQMIAGSALRTPLVRLNVRDAAAEIYLKLENLQPIGSFKIRGATNAMAHMTPETLSRGVLTASAGNMAQGRVIKVPFEAWWRTFEERSFPGVEATFIHAFDDLNVMAGNGTIALEIIEDLPEVDVLLVPWGGGGLTCGIAAAMRALNSKCKIYAVEVATAAPLVVSLAAGSPQTVDYQPSFVDGIGAKLVFPQMLERAQQLIDGSLVAQLDEVKSALRLMAERNRIIAEGAGACALACALAGKAGGGKVVCIVSGGNIDFATLCEILIDTNDSTVNSKPGTGNRKPQMGNREK